MSISLWKLFLGVNERRIKVLMVGEAAEDEKNAGWIVEIVYKVNSRCGEVAVTVDGKLISSKTRSGVLSRYEEIVTSVLYTRKEKKKAEGIHTREFPTARVDTSVPYLSVSPLNSRWYCSDLLLRSRMMADPLLLIPLVCTPRSRLFNLKFRHGTATRE